MTISNDHIKGLNRSSGFTLIELAMVLVVIGLVAGGILVGKDLYSAAQLRAQGSQIESYRAALNTFRLKYEALPGDMAKAKAEGMGFAGRAGYSGRGNGDWVLQDYGRRMGTFVCRNEKALFWRDLSEAKLIPETLSIATDNGTDACGLVLPKAKIRRSYISVWSGGFTGIVNTTALGNRKNYFAITTLSTDPSFYHYGRPSLFPSEALDLDQKFDDGFPHTGRITAMFPYHDYGVWSSGINGGAWGGGVDSGVAVAASDATCYDNNNNASNRMQYTTRLGINNPKCALSFEIK